MAKTKLTHGHQKILLEWLAADYSLTKINRMLAENNMPTLSRAALSYYRKSNGIDLKKIHRERVSQSVKEGLKLRKRDFLVRKGEPRKKVIYLFGSSVGLTKIGISNDVGRRIKDLNYQCPIEIFLLFSFDCNNTSVVERSLHSLYSHLRVKGEWFNLSSQDIDDIRKEYCAQTDKNPEAMFYNV